ncbi:WD40-repeat-containing domain protein [Scenedesmus sp. NREL 46B-D3]|nr:WD40-repeat-containing domain protein [Scenedesmus sp. NREL 46B-D3]
MQMPCSAIGGSMASCCSWLPAAPHDQLLVGCWDGNVAIWQLPTTAGGSAQPIQLLRADPTPVHAVAWQPCKRWWLTGDTPEAAAAVLDGQSSSSSSSNRGAANGHSSGSASAPQSCQYFLTASNIGNVRIWDAQDVLQPLHERVVNRNAVNAALWMGPPHVLVLASADGMLRQLWVDAGAQATSITAHISDVSGSCGSVWSLAGCEVLSVVAYVSDGGLLGILPMEPPTGEARHRKSHAALSAVAVDEDQLWLLSAREVPGNGGLYENSEAWDDGDGSSPRLA